MYVHKINIQHFRNIHFESLELSDGINILYGNNAQGKTNLLESVYMCATGRSQRTKNEREIIEFDYEESHVQVFVREKKTNDKIDLHIRKDMKKAMAVNGIPVRKLSELFGVLLTVIFSPEDLQLIKSGPAERRKYIDLELCQLNKVYYHDLQQYYKILKQRNILLKKIKINKKLRDTLSVWDSQMSEYGEKIVAQRSRFIHLINPIAEKIHGQITNHLEKLQILYKPNISGALFMDRLLKNIERDIFIGNTSSGIHKDDLIFLINGVDARVYGSQGQQRTASLSAKLAEIEIIKNQKNKTPVLLLDDVMSELDMDRQKFLLEYTRDLQTILTCTGIDTTFLNHQWLFDLKNKAEIYQIVNGKCVKPKETSHI